jgi:hypothetical protein
LEDLKVPVLLKEDRLEDLLEDLKVDLRAQVLLKAGHLEDRLEDWKVDLKAQVLLKAGHWDLKMLVLLVLEFEFQALVDPLFHPLLRMLHRASNRVWPLRLVLLLVLQMFSCRPWSSLTKPYLAA